MRFSAEAVHSTDNMPRPADFFFLRNIQGDEGGTARIKAYLFRIIVNRCAAVKDLPAVPL